MHNSHTDHHICTNVFTHTHAHTDTYTDTQGHESIVDICCWARMHGDPDSANFPATTLWNVILHTKGLTRKPVICAFHPQHVMLLMACALMNFNLMEYLKAHGDLMSVGALRSTGAHLTWSSLWCWILESWIKATSLCDVSCSKIYRQWLICHATNVDLCIIQSH